MKLIVFLYLVFGFGIFIFFVLGLFVLAYLFWLFCFSLVFFDQVEEYLAWVGTFGVLWSWVPNPAACLFRNTPSGDASSLCA